MSIQGLDDLHQELERLRDEVEESNESLRTIARFTEDLADGIRLIGADRQRAESLLIVQSLAMFYIGLGGCIWATDVIFGLDLRGVGAGAIQTAFALLAGLTGRLFS